MSIKGSFNLLFPLALLTISLILLLLCTQQVVESRIIKKHNFKYFNGFGKQHLNTKFYQNPYKAQTEKEERDWINLKLDNFNPLNNETFQARYWVNTQYWNKQKNGPVFIVLGQEAPSSSMNVNGNEIWLEHAKRYGALVASMEHRYYGMSVPKQSLSTSNLKYLTSQQALEDAVTFRRFLITKFGINENQTKFIAYGGSYSGNLSAWIKQKYPHLFTGALSSSAPLLAKLEFNEYMQVVAQSIGPSCFKRIRQANDQIELLLKTKEGKQKVIQLFNVCNPSKMENELDLATFISSLTEGVCGIVQYNNEGGSKYNITSMCNIIENVNYDALQAFANWVKLYSQEQNESCLENDYNEMIDELKDERIYPYNDNAGARSWIWQTCVEFGYFQNAKGPNQPFSERLSLNYYIKQCSDIFGIKGLQPNIQFTNDYYGARNIDTTNTFFTAGTIDPWHALALTTANKYVEQQNIYLVQGMAHCGDLGASSPRDSPSLRICRQKVEKFLDNLLPKLPV